MQLKGTPKFLFVTMMQAAIRMRAHGKNKKDYVKYAGDIWDSMTLTDINDLNKDLHDLMERDLEELVVDSEPTHGMD